MHRAAAHRLDVVRAMLEGVAREAGDAAPATMANKIQILMLGATTSADPGDRNSARDARELALLLLSTTCP